MPWLFWINWALLHSWTMDVNMYFCAHVSRVCVCVWCVAFLRLWWFWTPAHLQSSQGLNALHHASQLANAELSTKCVMQLTSLDFEAMAWQLDLAMAVDAQLCQAATMGDCNGDTAIHSAAERGRLEAALTTHLTQFAALFEASRYNLCELNQRIRSHVRFFASSSIGFLRWTFWIIAERHLSTMQRVQLSAKSACKRFDSSTQSELPKTFCLLGTVTWA